MGFQRVSARRLYELDNRSIGICVIGFQRVSARRLYEFLIYQICIPFVVSSVSLHVGYMNSSMYNYKVVWGFQRVSARRLYELSRDQYKTNPRFPACLCTSVI